VLVVNVGNPSNPVTVGTLATSASSVALVGTNLHVVDGMQMKTIDVSTPSAPVLRGSSSAYGAMRLDASGGVAFLASANMSPTQGGLYTVNVSAPASPSVLAQIYDVFDTKGVAVAGTRGVSAGAEKGMKVVDLADPTLPRVLGTLPGTIVAVAIAGQTAYALELVARQPVARRRPSGERRRDSDDRRPARSRQRWLGHRIRREARRLAPLCRGEHVEAARRERRELDRAHPRRDGEPCRPTASSVALAGRYAYVAAGSSVQVVDVLTPSNPVVVGSLATSASSVALAGSRLYGVDGMQLKVMDVTTPTSPTLTSATNGYGAQAVAASGTTVYLATPGMGHGDAGEGIRSIDASNPSAPSSCQRLVVPGRARALAIGSGAFLRQRRRTVSST
jgi:hypothetical protein